MDDLVPFSAGEYVDALFEEKLVARCSPTRPTWRARCCWPAARPGARRPNPMVGAVVVDADGVVVGAGFHARAGEPHAEVRALDAAGAAARGATLYCTLEPCSHHGRTPPCVDRVIAAGIARVVAAVQDPNPRVSGRGFRALTGRRRPRRGRGGRRGGPAAERAVFQRDARGRPFVIAKIATSLDGRVAAGPGRATRLSATAADRQTQLLRARVDAIAVGSGTMLTDDPR